MLRQLYQLNQPYRGYQKADKKRVYQIDNDVMEDQPERFHTTFKTEDEEVTYSDKGFNKVFVNFVRIEAICSKCHSFFPSKSKLYNHIKTGCIEEALLSSSA